MEEKLHQNEARVSDGLSYYCFLISIKHCFLSPCLLQLETVTRLLPLNGAFVLPHGLGHSFFITLTSNPNPVAMIYLFFVFKTEYHYVLSAALELVVFRSHPARFRDMHHHTWSMILLLSFLCIAHPHVSTQDLRGT